MDDRRFDDFTRRLAGMASRRQVLGGLTAGAAAILAGALSQSRAIAVAPNCGVCNGIAPGRDRGRCRSSCAQIGGFPAGCTSVDQLCPSASGDYTCCVSGETCQGGACGSTCKDEGVGCNFTIPGQEICCTGLVCCTPTGGSGSCQTVEACNNIACMDDIDCPQTVPSCINGFCRGGF